MSLQNPLQKMSKSESDPAGTINLTDSPDDIQKKIMRAVTDSGSDVRAGNDKPALTNLINIFAACTRATVDDVQSQYASKGYGDFKKDLAEALVTTLAPIQSRFTEVSNDSAALHEVLNHGLKKSRAKSSQKLQQARDAMGLV